jgi:hypothetical protein
MSSWPPSRMMACCSADPALRGQHLPTPQGGVGATMFFINLLESGYGRSGWHRSIAFPGGHDRLHGFNLLC